MTVPPPANREAVAPLKLPPLTEEQLDNGISVVTVQKRDLPLVAVRLVLQTGAARDPKGKEGIASFTGGLLRRGTKARTGDEVDDAIESIGGLLGVDSGYETTAIAATVPSENVEVALKVIAELAREPSFPKKEVDVARRQLLAHIVQELDDPSSVADRAIAQFFYGKQHPYGRPAEGRAPSVKTFQRADVVNFHKATYSPQGALLLFVGDIEPAQSMALAKKVLGSWKGKALPKFEPAAPPAPEKVEILLVDKPDASQAQVRAAVDGLARFDSRYYAAVVANTVVGGGFTSRLVDEVRVNRGLSYSVSTRLVPLKTFGAISYSTFTKTETVRQILDVSLGVLDTFSASGPSVDELEKAKRYVIGLYPSRVESIDSLAEALAAARTMGLPFDEIEKYRDRVAAADTEAVQSVAKLWPSSKAAKIVVVGDAKKIAPQLEGLGEVTVVKATALK